MNPQKQELLKKLGESQNILVTVSANPSVDQLAACLGITLLLNKLKKHATAVFSGEVPSTIEFLQPEQTIEKNTDSLRDFIISLDKNKADKLRYKVEDQVVRIFITPYRTSISDKDLEYSQGDFNVDVVLCLGVNRQEDLDHAITAHGRILHDAVVMSINTHPGGELGTINWTEQSASSLSELVAELADSLGRELVDGQIATSMLTGIVAETDRFSNEKTTPETMRLSAELMAAGANQQLVASELAVQPAPEEPAPDVTSEGNHNDSGSESNEGAAEVTPPEAAKDTVAADGTLEISHPALPEDINELELPEPVEPEIHDYEPLNEPDFEDIDEPLPADEQTDDDLPQAEPDNEPDNQSEDQSPQLPTDDDSSSDDTDSGDDDNQVDANESAETPPASRMVLQPPSMGGTLTANSTPDQEPLRDPLTSQPDTGSQAFLNHPLTGRPTNPLLADDGTSPPPEHNDQPFADVPVVSPAQDFSQPANQTLTQLETNVDSPHIDDSAAAQAAQDTQAKQAEALDAARAAVNKEFDSTPSTTPLPPVQASGAMGYLNVQDLPPSNIVNTASAASESSEADLTEAAAQSASVDVPTLPLPPPVAQPTAAAPSVMPVVNTAPPSAPPVPPPLPLASFSQPAVNNPA